MTTFLTSPAPVTAVAAAAAWPGLFRGFDAAVPPPEPYPGCQAALGYLGPAGRTPHVWTLEEWLRFAMLRQAGIWLYDPAADASAAGRAAAAAAKALGWFPFAKVRRLIWLDMEMTEDRPWIAAWAAAVWDAGFVAGDYRSLSSVVPGGDPVLDKWVADWDSIPEIEWPQVKGHQYKAQVPFGGTFVDLNVFSGSILASFGHGPRKLVT